MEEIFNDNENWRKYEKLIANNLKQKFPKSEITFDDLIFGVFSKTDRQIDISIHGELAGNKILGVVDCKYYSKNIDVKAVESFLGILEDVRANIGIMITNHGYSTAAINRAAVGNLTLEIVKVEELGDLEIDVDEIINQKIKNLRLSKFEFFKRLKENWNQIDIANSSYSKRIISFKEGFANTEYFAYKKSIRESARIFRDFAEISKITLKIPSKRLDDSTEWKEEMRLYECKITRTELESFLNLNFWELKQDIKKWRSEFLNNPIYDKQSILYFAGKFISSRKF